MSGAEERDACSAKRAARSVANAARSLAQGNERKGTMAERKRARDERRAPDHLNGVELARDEAARLRGFTTG
jgi:hypothetical protein